MKTVDNTDTDAFFLDKSDYNRLGIRVENEKRTRTGVQAEPAGAGFCGKAESRTRWSKTCVVLDSGANKIVKKMAS
jgi:hypothetical protein